MTTQALPPKRIADYFFMVGLEENFLEMKEPQAGNSQERRLLKEGELKNENETIDYTLDSITLGGDGGELSTIDYSTSMAEATSTHSSPLLGNTNTRNLSPLPHTSTTTTKNISNRARSKSMALASRPHFNQTILEYSTKEEETNDNQDQLKKPIVPFTAERPLIPSPSTPTSSARKVTYNNLNNVKRPSRRSVTLSDVSQQGSIGIQRKPSYRHVSAGILYKSMQEGIQRDLMENDQGKIKATGTSNRNESSLSPNKPPAPERANTLSVQEMKNLAFGKNIMMNRSKSKGNMLDSPDLGNVMETTTTPLPLIPPDVHPAERNFSPVVTCRYPETDWEDSEAFPPHLPMFCFPGELSFKVQQDRPPTTYHSFVMTQETGNRSYAMCVTLYERPSEPVKRQLEELCRRWTRSKMSESEEEYVRLTKSKISVERSQLKTLRERLRHERTFGRQSSVLSIKREIVDSEEKLALLQDQMQLWEALYVDPDEIWIPRCIGLVSAIPYHYLLRDWLLAVVVACSGGVDHPGMSSSSLRLERYVRNIIHDVSVPPFGKLEIAITVNNRLIYASRPALNSVPIVKNFSLYPLFRCITAEDVVTLIEVMLSEGKIIFLSSHMGMLTLASESILYLFFPLYWQGVYIPILPASLMTCLQAPVPYIIGVERSCCDPEFPPEDACVVDLDKGTVNVQLPPLPLPPRPRRKLVQSLEQYSLSTTASHRPQPPPPTSNTTMPPPLQASTFSDHSSTGPPTYVQEAFPHSRLTLFCGVSRAPRRNTSTFRRDSLKPLAASTFSTQNNSASNSSQDLPSPALSRRASAIALNIVSGSASHGNGGTGGGMNLNAPLPKLPKMDFEKETLMEGLGGELTRNRSTDEISRTSISDHSHERVSPLIKPIEGKDLRSNKVAPDQETTDPINSGARKSLTLTVGYPNQQQPINISNNNRTHSFHNTHLATPNTSPPKQLIHRASVASMESTGFKTIHPNNSATGTGSPVSTMTSNTMLSINGPSNAPGEHQCSSTSSTVSLPYTQAGAFVTSTNSYGGTGSGGNGGIGFLEEEVEKDPSPLIPISKEGHILISVPTPIPLAYLNSRCGICSQALGSNQNLYRCDGCTLLVHTGCMEELLYPCVPRGFDESGICWSVLQMWAGLLKGYRSGILAGQQALQQQQILLQMEQQNQQNMKTTGHSKQPSSGSEGMGLNSEKENNRFSWASIRGWAARSSTGDLPSQASQATQATTHGMKSPPGTPSSSIDQGNNPSPQPPQQQQSFTPRARRGTNTSVLSDTVRFHRDMFMRGVEKEAKTFMTAFTETQAFVQFVQDRVDRSPGDPEIMFFDEVIKAKINRSRFRLGKEETRFLDDTSYGIQTTSKSVPPSGELHDYDNNSRQFPKSLDPAYL